MKLIDPLKHFLQIKSISTSSEHLVDMQTARHFLKDFFEQMEFSVHFFEGLKHPAVFAQKIIDPKFPTVLIYGHYDVQPSDPDNEWISPAFEPTIRDNKIYARGATDNKGQIMAQILAVKEYLSQSNPKINFKFIIEGEEEIGSISVEKICKEHKKQLQADFLIVSDTEMPSKGQPSIDISLRGLLYTEIIIETANQDIHSGQFGGLASNPAIILAQVINKLKDDSGRVLIPKFYDKVLGESVKEKKLLSKTTGNIKQIMTEGDFFVSGGGENWYSVNQRRWSRPTLDVNGMESGYTGEGSKTIIPAQAMAKISMRLVPNQDPKEIYANLCKYLQKIVPKNCKLTVINHAGAYPYKAPTDHPVFDQIMASQKKIFGRESIFQGIGGSIGFIPVITKHLNIPCIMIGLGLPDEALHAPNEHIDLDNFHLGIETMIDFYQNLRI